MSNDDRAGDPLSNQAAGSELDALLSLAFGAPSDAGAGTRRQEAVYTLEPGTLLSGRYRVRGELGRGGVGAVYDAFDEALGRAVAVKVLSLAQGAHVGQLERFYDEAHVCARLEHPGVVPVHDIGAAPDGRPYFVMKRIDGRPLTAYVGAQEPGERRGQLLHVFEQVCRAVGAAHVHGIVHRDLKPSNILVDATGEPLVVDWGLAKMLSQRALPAQHEVAATEPPRRPNGRPRREDTLVGALFGTPAYMAPEQARGEHDRVDPRSDVFALGAILCELITGSPPYRGERPEVLIAARAAALDGALSELDRADADPALRALARECLAVERDDRPADATHVARRVADIRDAAAERARSAERRAEVLAARAELERRIRRWQLGAAVLVVVALAFAADARLRSERRALERSLQAARAVDEVLGEVNELQESSREGEPVWKQIELALARAEAIAAAGDADAPTHERIVRVRERVLEELVHARGREREESLSRRLSEITRRVIPEFDYVTADLRFAEVFAELGVVPGHDAPVEELRASGIRAELVAALELWAGARLRTAGPNRDEEAAGLRALASQLDERAHQAFMRRAVSFDVTPDHMAIVDGRPRSLAVHVVLDDGTHVPLTRASDRTRYRSLAEDVAEVDEEGVVHPRGPGRAVVLIENERFSDVVTVDVAPGDTLVTLSGVVVGPDGAPVAEAEVAHGARRALTDGQGRYSFADTPAGLLASQPTLAWVAAAALDGHSTLRGRLRVADAAAPSSVAPLSLSRGTMTDCNLLVEYVTRSAHAYDSNLRLLGRHALDFSPRAVAREGGGDHWIGGAGVAARMAFVGDGAQELARLELPGWELLFAAVAPDGTAWFTVRNQQRLIHLSPAGALLGVRTLPRDELWGLTIARRPDDRSAYYVFAACGSAGPDFTGAVVRLEPERFDARQTVFPGDPVRAMTVSREGLLWVSVDTRGPGIDRLQAYDLDFRYLERLPCLHDCRGMHDLCESPDGRIWVLALEMPGFRPQAPLADCVYEFDPSQRRPLAHHEVAYGDVLWLDGGGNLWSVDRAAGRAHVLNLRGAPTRTVDVMPRRDDGQQYVLGGLGDPSGYEQAWIMHPTVDFDGDGMSNEEELRLGRNPFAGD